MLKAIKSIIPQRHPLRLIWHNAKAFLAACLYRFPARNLTIIGITGTDGKTTTAGMIAHILHESGIRVGALSTAFFRIGESVSWNTTEKTSPSPFVIQRFLREAVRHNCSHVVLEYSSHGLVQGRTRYTWPKVAGITNTAMEHLDYHGSMEQYRADKSLLFQMLGGQGMKVLNGDDETYDTYRQIRSKDTTVYSICDTAADLFGADISSTPTQASCMLDGAMLRLPIPGAYNIENALCAIGCCEAIGIDRQVILGALTSFQNASGRMERVDAGQPFSVFIDFTVTPQAFEKTLQTLRSMIGNENRLIVMTGSCGDRMKEKRPIVGRICSTIADIVIITDEEPYTEDPLSIIEEVWAGVDQVLCDAYKIPDRRSAMQKAFSVATAGDAVLLCGLGSYPSRMMADGPIPWDERAIAIELLQDL